MGACESVIQIGVGMNSRIDKIRESEKQSHTKIYNEEDLYNTDSWLKKPIKTVQDIIPLLSDHECFRALDLGCGIGRNSIYIAEQLVNKGGLVDCVDILDIAIEKLRENACIHGVEEIINGTVSTIEQFSIPKSTYDLILAVSALEHVESEKAFLDKLQEINEGIKSHGIVCLVINSEVKECKKDTGEDIEPQFEVNLPTTMIQSYIDKAFEGWSTIKKTVSSQEYDIPRGFVISHLTTNVITFVGQAP